MAATAATTGRCLTFDPDISDLQGSALWTTTPTAHDEPTIRDARLAQEQAVTLTVPVALALAVPLALLAAGVTWLLRSRRCQREKAALNSGWQRQIDAQQAEQQRVAARNEKLKTKLNEVQAGARMQKERIQTIERELLAAKRRRDELQRDIQQLRSGLENELQKPATQDAAAGDALATSANEALLAEKDRKIRRLRRELKRWQERVPPLVERYRERDAAANELAALHAAAVARLAQMETRASTDETRLEPLAEESIRHLDASNDQYDDTLAVRNAEIVASQTNNRQGDDLQRIKGIGPSIEKTLNRLGISSFEHLAALTPVEVDRVAAELRGFHSRIEREDWIGQAEQLIQERGDA